jgi:DNA-binding transcriptional LysR family regulator
MDQMLALRTFVAVANQRSFVEAARALGISPTAASRGVAGLEETLGVTLLRRTTRSVALTPEGETYLDRCRRALEELDDAARALRGDTAEPRGSLIVTAPVVFGRMHILPIVDRLLRDHPGLDVRLTLTDRVVRLVEEGIDVAVRIADLADSALHAVRLTEVRRVLVASPTYLKSRGIPATSAELGGHDLIGFDNFTRNGEWRLGRSGDEVVRCEPRLMTNSVEAAVDAAISGLGIARVLDYQVAQHIAAGRLRYVLAALDPSPVPVSLVYQANRLRSPNARALIDAARRHFSLAPARARKPAAGRGNR